MQALFVHGLGRTPLSGWRLLRQLKSGSIRPLAFGYTATFERFASIRDRLTARIAALAACDEYVVIGHSLGGVLTRAALGRLPEGTRQPRQVFLLGSPIQPAWLAQKLQRTMLFKLLAGDCGQLLASEPRMAQIPSVLAPTISIIGTTGWSGRMNPFGRAVNDGIVSAAEAYAPWIDEEIRVPGIHTYLPSNRQVCHIILEHLMRT